MVKCQRQNQKCKVRNHPHGVLACPEFKQMEIWMRWDVLRNVNYVKHFMQTLVSDQMSTQNVKIKNVKFVISLIEWGPSRVKQMEIYVEEVRMC